jgi:hypothetical protein
MKRILACALFIFSFFPAFANSTAAQVVDASICDILANPQSFDAKVVRVKGTVQAGFDEFVVKGTGCRQQVNAIWLAYPEGAKGKAGPAAFLQIQLSRNNPATAAGSNRLHIELEKNADFKQFDALLATAYKGGGMCLGCVRYTVTATLVGRLDGVKDPGIVRDSAGKFVGVTGFGNLNRYAARLVLQSVSDVSSQEIDYSKAPAKGDSPSQSGGDPVAAGHQAARAFGSGTPQANQVESAAAAFGKQGEDNGVSIGFGVANEIPKNDGPKGEGASPDGLLLECTFDADRLKGDALARAIAHVGTHIADVRGPQPAKSPSLYELEYHAWQTVVLSAVAFRQNTLILPGGYIVWNSSWPNADRGQMMNEALTTFLSEWASLTR